MVFTLYWDKQAVKLQTVNYSVEKTASTDYNLYQSKKLDAAKYSKYFKKQAQKYFAAALRKLDKKSISFTIMGDNDDMSKKAVEYLQSA